MENKEDVSAYFLHTSLWPAVLFTVLAMIIGIVGNGLVLVIYRNHFHKSVTWIFIYFLAALDIATCLVSMPSEMIIIAEMVSFPSWPWCKISRYLSFVLHGSSCVILMAIAFNRYDRICRPTNQWLNKPKAKKACLGVTLFACAINIPSLVIYGEARVPIAIQNGTAKMITVKDEEMYAMERSKTASWHNAGGVSYNSTIPRVIYGSLCMVSSEYSNSLLTLVFLFIQFVLYTTLVVLVIFFYSKVIKKMVGYRARQESLFQVLVPTRRKKSSVKEGSEEDVKSDSYGNDVTADPFSNTPDEPVAVVEKRPSGDKISPKENGCHMGDNSRCKGKSPRGAASAENLTGRPVITLTVSTDGLTVNGAPLSRGSNPAECNSLLSRRIRSVESLSKSVGSIPSLVVPNMGADQNSKTPLFLHANKTHKKRGKYESDRGGRLKCKSDEQILIAASESKDDLYLHKAGAQEDVAKSMELVTRTEPDPLNLGSNTMTLNRRSPKGSKQCVLPISGLSVKSVTAYDGVQATGEETNEGQPSTGTSDTTTPSQKNEASGDVDEAQQIDDATLTKVTISHNSETADDIELSDDPDSNISDAAKSDSGHVEQQKNGKAKIDVQQSVTFRVKGENSSTQAGGRARKTVSISPMLDTPGEVEKRSSSIRTNSGRPQSLVSASPKTLGYNRRMSVKPIKAMKSSSMLLCISLAFVLSFLPFWIIVLWRSVVGKSFIPSLSPAAFGVVSVFIRSSLVSNAINPVVYGLLNSQFRNRCKKIFCRR